MVGGKMKDQKWQKDGPERGTVFRSGPHQAHPPSGPVTPVTTPVNIGFLSRAPVTLPATSCNELRFLLREAYDAQQWFDGIEPQQKPRWTKS